MTLSKARSYAYRLLALRSYPSSQLRQKLARKGFEEAVCEQVIEEIKVAGYINDEEYAVRSVERLKNRGYGPRYIKEKCRMQGIEATVLVSEEEQREQIRKLLAKKPLPKEKAMRMLERRGFSLALIFQEVEKFS